MKTIIISDDDYVLGKMPEVSSDLLISLGDLYDETILRVAEIYGCKTVAAVRGNHDTSAPFPEGIDDLHLRQVVIEGITFGGFSGCWRYKSRGHHLFEQWEVDRIMATYPPVDVFMAHNSPRGIHERDKDIHQGFDGFREYIDRVQPRYFLHGHQHVNQISKIGRTEIVGIFGEVVMELKGNG